MVDLSINLSKLHARGIHVVVLGLVQEGAVTGHPLHDLEVIRDFDAS